jgi:hypothetical protein
MVLAEMLPLPVRSGESKAHCMEKFDDHCCGEGIVMAERCWGKSMSWGEGGGDQFPRAPRFRESSPKKEIMLGAYFPFLSGGITTVHYFASSFYLFKRDLPLLELIVYKIHLPSQI